MAIVGLVVQQHDGTILFQNVREYLSPEKANLAAKAFKNQISSYDNAFISRGSTNHLSGSIVVLNMYRIHYMILNEIFILAIAQANDNPYEGAIYLARAKRVLISVSKDIILNQLNKKNTEIYFALERVLFGEDGVEVLSQRVSEVQPHIISNHHSIQHTSTSSTPSFNIGGGSQPITTPISVGGRSGNSIGSIGGGGIDSIPTLKKSKIQQSDQQKQLDSLWKLDGITIPDKIFTQPDTLPKVDKHIYDPPQTVKWGNTSAQPISSLSRVNNRIISSESLPTSPDLLQPSSSSLTSESDTNFSNNESIIPTRKFSLSMGTFKNKEDSSGNLSNSNSSNKLSIDPVRPDLSNLSKVKLAHHPMLIINNE
eukprot:gene4108-5140_t